MGQEYDEPNPFLFFTDYGDPALQQAVREGRKQEFKDFDFANDEVPDPQDPATFERSKLNWQLTQGENLMLDWYTSLLALRKKFIKTCEPTCEAKLIDGVIHMQIPCEEPTLKSSRGYRARPRFLNSALDGKKLWLKKKMALP